MAASAAAYCCLALTSAAVAQPSSSRCTLTIPVVSPQSRPNIFSLQQEVWLGDAMRDHMEASARPVRNSALNAHLQMLVDRLEKNLPEPHVAFHVVLLESSEVNGFSIAGGSIYINRRLAATVRSDDEMAAVLGHEMGHIASHQFAFEMTAEMKRLLHIDRVGDRADVYARFQELEDAAMKDRHPPKSREDDEQDEADRIGVYLTAAAGYRPQALGEFWDRTFFVGGKTGSSLGDFFGITSPGQKRLRGMLKVSSELPAGCRESTSSAAGVGDFAEWQRRVIENQKAEPTSVAPPSVCSGAGGCDSSSPAATRIGVGDVKEQILKLSDALQVEMDRVRFSPDGTMVLAQNESSIYVLTRDPWAVKFRIDADRAQNAWFSPDNRTITFSTPGLHTEVWSVADGKLVEAHEPVSRHECFESKLSPDGRTVICETLNLEDLEVGLSLLDSTSGAILWENRDFFKSTMQFARELYQQHAEEIPSSLLWSSFSGDGNFLLIGPGDRKIGFDLQTRTPLKIGGQLKSNIDGPFAFLSSNQVVGGSLSRPKDSGVFSFPNGKRVNALPFALANFSSVSDPDNKLWVLTDTVQQAAADGKPVTGKEKNSDGTPMEVTRVDQKMAIADLVSRKYIIATKSTALDAWREYLATEGPDGSLVLLKQPEPKGKLVHLPLSPIAHLRAIAISPDGRFLAYSTRDRGGVWDLRTNRRLVLLRPFAGATWTNNTTAYLEFPKSAQRPREICSFDLAGKKSEVMQNVSDTTHLRLGHLIAWKKDAKGNGGTLVMHRLGTNDVVWSRAFPDGYPRYTVSDDGSS